jgi:hypothetical protein
MRGLHPVLLASTTPLERAATGTFSVHYNNLIGDLLDISFGDGMYPYF